MESGREQRKREHIDICWHFALKFGPGGEITTYKPRFEAKGFGQVPGLDYNKT